MHSIVLGILEYVDCLSLFSLFLEEGGVEGLFEVTAGGGDNFEEGEVVFAGKFSLGGFLGGAGESFCGGEGFWAEVLEEVFEGAVDHFEEEFDEVGGVTGAVGFFQGLVVVLLMILDEGLDRDELSMQPELEEMAKGKLRMICVDFLGVWAGRRQW